MDRARLDLEEQEPHILGPATASTKCYASKIQDPNGQFWPRNPMAAGKANQSYKLNIMELQSQLQKKGFTIVPT